MFTISRGMNEAPAKIAERQAIISASDIMGYCQQIERNIFRLIQKGCSENDISFENSRTSGYEHADTSPEKCKIFNLSGGKVSYKEGVKGVDDIIFSASNAVSGSGEDCADNSCADLAAIFKVNETLCTALNNNLKIDNIEEHTVSTDKFTGSFNYSNLISPTENHKAACTLSGSDYYFYYVLYPR